jgi:hypothetical protein
LPELQCALSARQSRGRIVEINRNFLAKADYGRVDFKRGIRNDRRQRDPPDVTRFKAAAAKRVQAHRARERMGLRCLTVRVSDRTVRHPISTGYLALESREAAAAVAFALEAWVYDNVPEQARWDRSARAAYGRLPTIHHRHNLVEMAVR